MKTMYDYIHARRDRPQDIRTAALYSTSAPLLKPRYWAAEIGQGIKKTTNAIITGMPWMEDGWIHPLSEERRGAAPNDRLQRTARTRRR